MSKVLSTRYNSLIKYYHGKNSALGPSELADFILQNEGLDVSDDTMSRMCKRWLWNKQGAAGPQSKTGNKLVIGDLHAPFILEGYLEFCKGLYKKYNCDSVVFIGDVVDAAGWNFHEKDPDGMSAGHELDAAIAQLQAWYAAFPIAKVCWGNHDLLVARKAKANGMSQRFVKSLPEILHCPSGWEFVEEFTENNVLYRHGTIGDAFKYAKEARISTVQGHHHTTASVNWSVSTKDRIFGLNVGCGIDNAAYSFAYNKPFSKKPVISAGLILENGRLPIVELMSL